MFLLCRSPILSTSCLFANGAVCRAFHRGVPRRSGLGPAAGVVAIMVRGSPLRSSCRIECRLHTPACLLTFFIFAFWHGNHVTTDPGYQRSRQKPFDANEHTVTLLVLSEPKLDHLRSIQRFVALVSCIDNRPVHFQVSAECSGEPFSYGDRIIAQGNFYLPTSPLNPGEFDFEAIFSAKTFTLTFEPIAIPRR